MIIHDENAEGKIVHTLEQLRAEHTPSRCIHLALAGMPPIPHAIEHIVASARQTIPSTQAQLYVCGDGDIFILSPTLPMSDFKHFTALVSGKLGMQANENWIRLREVTQSANELLFLIEQKIDAICESKESLRKIQQAQMADRKRAAILSTTPEENVQAIARRRTSRAAPELMVVEDDIFSRKLVENVIHKQYPITSIGEASSALETYVLTAPDVLFLDINLPDVSGHELLEKIMAIDPDAYVIMLSGNADRANIMQAITHGAKGFIAKPFTREKILQYIERCPTITH